MDAFDDIDMGGPVMGVVRLPAERILGDHPEGDVPKPLKQTSTRNPVDVRSWDAETFTMTLSVGVRLSRKALSDCISEWRVAHPRIDRVRCYVSRHPLMNLPIHVLHHCGFARTGVELCWERDFRKKESKPEPTDMMEPKPEPAPLSYAAERLAAAEESIAFCTKNGIRQQDRELEKAEYWRQVVREEKAAASRYPEIDAQIAAIGKQLAEMQKGKS